MTNPADLISQFLSVSLPIIVTMGLRELSARNRETKRATEFAVLLREYRLHAHAERAGALMAENIRFPREERR